MSLHVLQILEGGVREEEHRGSDDRLTDWDGDNDFNSVPAQNPVQSQV